MKSDIRDCFAKHNGDGEFLVTTGCHPFSVIPPDSRTNTVVYCTKQHCILKLVHKLGGNMPFAAILRSGLPSDNDISWVASFVGSRRLIFLGDADPPDLLIFAILRECLSIDFGGLTDQLLIDSDVELHHRQTISLSESEAAALPLVSECLGELSKCLGTWTSGLLASGRKIEVEALFNFSSATPAEITAALLVDKNKK